MSHDKSPVLPTDDQGRAVVHGYAITGDEETGYRGRVIVPLAVDEVVHGCRELLFADDLYDLLSQARAELVMRSMVGQAFSGALADAQRARGAIDERA